MARSTTAALPEAVIGSLESLLGDRFTRSQSVLDQHGRDESYLPATPPQAVVFPRNTEEVRSVVTVCSEYGVPIIPFGAGSSLEGHVLPVHGGVSLDLTQMNSVLAVHPEDFDVTLQAGVTRLQLERALADHGLFFPVDPGADATLGGMVATGASGTTTVRYGTMRENVLGLEVVLADGCAIRTGGRAKKSSAGYDLTRLMIGSEGTLGVITEITLRVQGIPEGISAAVCGFSNLAGAIRTAVEVIQWGLPVARVELLDEVAIAAVNRHSSLELAEEPTLFFEFHGTRSGVEEEARATAEIARNNGGRDFVWATQAGERHALWRARHVAYFAALALRTPSRIMSTDVCVPLSRLVECISETKAEVARASFPVPLVGHVGDGNFHLLLVIDPESARELAEATAINQSLVERALRMGGTCTGEHGVGLGKRQWMTEEHGPALAMMRAIKRAFDPQGILNPGKVLPA